MTKARSGERSAAKEGREGPGSGPVGPGARAPRLETPTRACALEQRGAAPWSGGAGRRVPDT